MIGRNGTAFSAADGRETRSMEEHVTKERALELLFGAWTPERHTETVHIDDAYGRVLAKDYYALHGIPVVRASGMDGVAVDSARFRDGVPDMSGWRPGVDYVRADTGDDFDDQFDAVIRIEDVTILPEGGLKLHEGVTVTPGMSVRGPGSTFKEGTKLTNRGLPLRGIDLAALAMGGITEVEVYRRPRIGFIPTGSELIPAGAPLKRGQNYDTNSIIAKHMLAELGAEPICYPIVRDDRNLLKPALDKALQECDAVVIDGGSSKGEEDYNTRLLESEGKLLLHWVLAGPGRPVGIAVCSGKPVINLAGPPVGMLFGMHWCIRALVCSFLGLPVPEGEKVRATLTEDMRCAPRFDFLNLVEVLRDGDKYYVEPRDRGRTPLPVILKSNALFVSPAGESFYAAGTEIEVELMRDRSLLPRYEGKQE